MASSMLRWPAGQTSWRSGFWSKSEATPKRDSDIRQCGRERHSSCPVSANRDFEFADSRQAVFAGCDVGLLSGHALRLGGRDREPRVEGAQLLRAMVRSLRSQPAL